MSLMTERSAPDPFDDHPQVARVLAAAVAISGDRDRALDWLKQPLTPFDHKTPLALIAEGRVNDLLRYPNGWV